MPRIWGMHAMSVQASSTIQAPMSAMRSLISGLSHGGDESECADGGKNLSGHGLLHFCMNVSPRSCFSRYACHLRSYSAFSWAVSGVP